MKKHKQQNQDKTFINGTTIETISHSEIVEDLGRLNEVKTITTPREKGRIRVQYDYSACPTMTEQHTAHLTDLNYLMEKYQPDELAAYIAARMSHRQEIIGHDFSNEPNLQDAMNITYRMKQQFNELPEEIRKHFRNHVEFLKFIDNPANQDTMIKLGLMTREEITKAATPVTTTTEEAKEQKEQPQSTN